MKKILALMLALVLVLSLVACGGNSDSGKEKKDDTATEEKSGLTTDDCVGVWILESGTGFPLNYSSYPDYCPKFRVLKGGVLQGFYEKDGTLMSEYQWEIKDDVFVISWDSMVDGFSLAEKYVFEVDGDTMKSVEGSGNSVYKKQQ